MKRWIAWLMAAVLVIGCCGAGLSVRTEAAGARPKVMARLTVGGAAAETGDEESGADHGEEADETELETGVLAGDVYENEFIGIGIALEDNWSFTSTEELEAINGFILDHTDSEELSDLLADGVSYIDMAASSEDGSNINITLQDISAVYSAVMTEDTVAAMLAEYMKESLQSVDYVSDVEFETSTVMLAGEERAAVRGHEVMFDTMDVYQTAAIILRGDYIASITISSYGEDTTDTLAEMFYSLDDGPGAAPADEPAEPEEEPADEPAEPEEEPVHFIDAMGSDGTYAYIDLNGISDWVYRDGSKRYYAAEDESFLYIVSVDEDQLAEMAEERIYWDRDEDSEEPPVYHLTGYMGTIDSEVRDAFMQVFEIDDVDFDYYFGDDFLDAVPTP